MSLKKTKYKRQRKNLEVKVTLVYFKRTNLLNIDKCKKKRKIVENC